MKILGLFLDLGLVTGTWGTGKKTLETDIRESLWGG